MPRRLLQLQLQLLHSFLLNLIIPRPGITQPRQPLNLHRQHRSLLLVQIDLFAPLQQLVPLSLAGLIPLLVTADLTCDLLHVEH